MEKTVTKTSERKDYKEESNQKDNKMKIFGRGKGFLGLSKKTNLTVNLISTALAVIGIAYFIRTQQPLTALSTFGLWLLVVLETNKA